MYIEYNKYISFYVKQVTGERRMQELMELRDEQGELSEKDEAQFKDLKR